LSLAPLGQSIVEQRTVGRADLPFEFMLNALRLIGGVPVGLFKERTGLDVGAIEVALAKAEALGLLERDWQTLRPTPKGQRFLNDLLELFLP
jgi:coproporphyrinogen III oxidase-like Fe-S oxidoreductase